MWGFPPLFFARLIGFEISLSATLGFDTMPYLK